MQVLGVTPRDTHGRTHMYNTQHFERCLQGECWGFRKDLEALQENMHFYKVYKQHHPSCPPHPIGTAPHELYAAAGDALQL